ncbi:hypothetical protein J3R83DRAFT_4536 [Lanmaoa asiatica]|nr:hypothetical protein J3R83DRAFT_4536 [Lanmaoa asiatica]
MVDIYLCYPEPDPKAPFLSIPNSDVEMLSNRPFCWLRYIMFSICGARGDLFRTLGATDVPVDYNTSLADLPAVVYYKPSGDCTFVDYQGLNDRITSTERTSRRESFRRDVLLRDGSCVVTGRNAHACDAAHLIPRSKGDEYIARVVQKRSHLYTPPPSITGIDDTQNGLLLDKALHWRLGVGEVAFLKTPNYGLEPTDIKRVDLGPECMDHITLQQLEKPKGYNPTLFASLIEMTEWEPDLDVALAFGAHLDVQFRGPLPPSQGSLPPPALILNYVYGVAAYNRWRSRQDGDEVNAAMEKYRSANYEDILPLRRQIDDDDPSSEQSDDRSSDNPEDADWTPNRSQSIGCVMAAAMDEMNKVLMSLHGITPQDAAIRWEKQREEEELKDQEASRSKVREWMQTTAIGGT